MKDTLRRIFWPILKIFEAGDEPFHYKALNRKVLIVVGLLFLMLAFAILAMIPEGSGASAYLSFVIFLLAGLVCSVVGWLGTDRAVAKIWGSR